MSHITAIKTQFKDRDLLLQALRSLGYTPMEGHGVVRGMFGDRETADIRIATKTSHFNIGFRLNGETYEALGDWWVVRDTEEKNLLQRLTQRYAYLATRAKLEAQGFTVATEQVEAKGRIHLVLRRME